MSQPHGYRNSDRFAECPHRRQFVPRFRQHREGGPRKSRLTFPKPLQFGDEGAGLMSVVAAHPSAEFVAGGYDSGELQLGDLKTRRSVVLRMSDGAAITCLAWSPDGWKLAVGTDAGALQVLDLKR